jgi:Na+/phosphate symporter
MLSRASAPQSRTVPIGNLLMRGAGAVLALIGISIFTRRSMCSARRRALSWSTPISPSISRWR